MVFCLHSSNPGNITVTSHTWFKRYRKPTVYMYKLLRKGKRSLINQAQNYELKLPKLCSVYCFGFVVGMKDQTTEKVPS